MGAGLQVFGENGAIKLDLTKRLPKIIGVKELTGSGEIRFERYPGMKPWYLVRGAFLASGSNLRPFLRIDNQQQRIIWGDMGVARVSIIYGVY